MIKVGVIGLGTVAQLMHLPILGSLFDLFEIKAVYDASPSLTQFISRRYNARQIKSVDDLVNDAEIDAVFVLSPDQYHAEHAKAALLAGKHVFIEKPVTLSPQDLQELINLEKQHPSQTCMVGYMRRFSRGFYKCAEQLTKEPREIEYMRLRDIILEGDFYIAQTKQPFIPADISEEKKQESAFLRRAQIEQALGAGCSEQQRISYQVLTGLGCHTLSAARELVGLPVEVKSVAVDGEHLVIVFQYPGFLATYEVVNDQKIVQFDAAIEIYQKERYLYLKYETPYLRYQPHTFTVVESDDNETNTSLYGPDYHDAFEDELKYFYDCVVNNKKPKTSLEDSMHDLLLFKQICNKIELGYPC